jgi:ABC-2 type transport system ATP-binding protein
MPDPLLLAEGLTKDYDSCRALDALDLAIPAGETFGLLGPNGSGKSTAIRLALGFLRPSAGRVRIAGFDAWAESLEVRRRVAYLPGELRLYESMTGRRLIHFLAGLRGERVTGDVDLMARKLDIDIDRPLIQMSSGMKRKVALLAVLTPQVPLIILDEPTNTLDPTMRDNLLDQLKLARDRGQTVLFSSHVLAEVEQVCDRVGILRLGKLAHLQSMAELRGGGHFVRARFDSPPATGPGGAALPAEARQPHGVVEFNHRGPLPELLDWLRREAAADVRVEPPGLAPVYRRIHGDLG